MEVDLSRLIDAFLGKRILVVGDAILDVYLDGSIARLCREAPIPVVDLFSERAAPGGAANTAANVADLGGEVSFLSVVGDDGEGLRLKQTLQEKGLKTEDILVAPGRRTLVKTRLISGDQMLARFDRGDSKTLSPAIENDLCQLIERHFFDADAVVLSDYGYGVVSDPVIRLIAELQRRMPRVILGDSAQLERFAGVGLTAVKPSYQEAIRLIGKPSDNSSGRAEMMSTLGDRVLEKTGAEIAAITLDVEGVVVVEHGRPPYRTYAKPARASRSTGGGDTFIAAFSLALATGADTAVAAEIASAASAVVVGKAGTETCSALELRDYLSGKEKRVTTPEELAARIAFYRGQGQRIVFTNGCFDILHRGHVGLLNRAKALGDILIVGVNSDESIRRLKGPERPINTLEDRVNVLAALSHIDHIIPFDSDTPADVIRAIRPDIFVKGGDYTRETLPEASLVEQLGGAICVLPLLEDRSTTGIIERIRQAAN